MMKKFSAYFIVIFLASFLLTACEKENDKGFAKIHWDRDTCERCHMVMSEKSYAVQIENPITRQKHKFDDIGCAVLWFAEYQQDWFETANIWVKNEKTQEWINAKTAFWTKNNITPMNYGLAAYTKDTFPQGKKSLSFITAVDMIKQQDHADRLNRKKKIHGMHDMHNKGK